MGGDEGEHVGQPDLRIDAAHLGGDDQAVHRRGALAAPVRNDFMMPAALGVRLKSPIRSTRWSASRLTVKRNRSGQSRWATDTEVIDLVRGLARQMSDETIAAVLNRSGKVPATNRMRARSDNEDENRRRRSGVGRP